MANGDYVPLPGYRCVLPPLVSSDNNSRPRPLWTFWDNSLDAEYDQEDGYTAPIRGKRERDLRIEFEEWGDDFSDEALFIFEDELPGEYGYA